MVFLIIAFVFLLSLLLNVLIIYYSWFLFNQLDSLQNQFTIVQQQLFSLETFLFSSSTVSVDFFNYIILFTTISMLVVYFGISILNNFDSIQLLNISIFKELLDNTSLQKSEHLYFQLSNILLYQETILNNVEFVDETNVILNSQTEIFVSGLFGF